MNFTKTLFAGALTSIGLLSAVSAQAVALNAGDVLTITNGVYAADSYGNITDVGSGSYFGMDFSGNAKIAGTEKTTIAMGTTGIKIGSTQAPGAIDSWFFNNATGMDWTNGVAVTGSTENGLDLSGWTVNWNGVNPPMTTGAWQPGNCASLGCSGVFTDGNAHFSWDGTDGGTYLLTYTATVPLGDPSGFGGTAYFLHLEGNVQLVPEAETYAMMLAGLGAVGLMARRRRAAA
jgi:hypothetical protein